MSLHPHTRKMQRSRGGVPSFAFGGSKVVIDAMRRTNRIDNQFIKLSKMKTTTTILPAATQNTCKGLRPRVESICLFFWRAGFNRQFSEQCTADSRRFVSNNVSYASQPYQVMLSSRAFQSYQEAVHNDINHEADRGRFREDLLALAAESGTAYPRAFDLVA